MLERRTGKPHEDEYTANDEKPHRLGHGNLSAEGKWPALFLWPEDESR
jgi:hypothetical protein